jgi:hypothetical protein
MKKIVLFICLLFTYFHNFSQTRWAHVTMENNGIEKTGIINSTGELLVPVNYNMILGDGKFFFVKQNKLWGCYSNKKNIIPVVYEDIGTKISEQLVRVKQKGKWGFVDLSNKTIIDFKFDFACNFYDGKAYAKIGQQAMYINKQGEILNTTNKERDFCFEDSDTTVGIKNQFKDSVLQIKQQKGKFGVIELKTKKVIIPIKYDEISRYFHNTILVRKGKSWGAYFDDGKLITTPKYKSIGIFWID